ncbi:MAG: YggS family pyridoxal phosphate-dependent enzyme [Planctomycetes bacterium]|nr:YggS family pyridoxal phosphate-dependent enzyme [Planctomycetota bacterium]
MTGIAERLATVRASIATACERCGRDPRDVALLAVSKFQPPDAVRAAIAARQLEFGENRVQELASKAAALAKDPVRWHMIGSVQTNKVEALVAIPGLALVHSIDRERLVTRLAEVCAASGRKLDVLVQMNATGEATKHGVPLAELEAVARLVVASGVLVLRGTMAMGPLTGDAAPVFRAVARAHGELRERLGLPLPILSLGMSGDLDAAIAAGSTLVRVGTAIFGERN